VIRFLLNDGEASVDARPGRVLLDVLRRDLRRTGTKEGCREGDCGACLVLVGRRENGRLRYLPVNSCLLPVGDLDGQHVVTVEGLNLAGLNVVQQAFVDEHATQCGFCTPGFIVAAAAFLLDAPRLDPEAAENAVAGNICRCTGYVSIRRALARVCAALPAAEFAASAGDAPRRIDQLIAWGALPDYFARAARRVPESAPPAAQPAPGQFVVAGGTDVYVQRPEQAEASEPVLLARRPELRGLRVRDGVCEVGAAATMQEFFEAPEVRAAIPCIGKVERLIASWPIRCRATLGGNLVNASPIGDTTILFLALDAELALSSGRTVPLRRFYQGYKKLDRRPDEWVAAVRFALPPAGARLNFEKVSRRTHLDIAGVNTAARFLMDGDRIAAAHLSAGGVAPVPLYLEETSAWLAGRAPGGETAREAAERAAEEVRPISDVRGAADYKRLLLRQLVLAHFAELFAEAGAP
jgi:xanthine dehydrogenase small subunit